MKPRSPCARAVAFGAKLLNRYIIVLPELKRPIRKPDPTSLIVGESPTLDAGISRNSSMIESEKPSRKAASFNAPTGLCRSWERSEPR